MRCAWLWGLGLLVLLAGCGNPIEPNGIRMGLAGPPQNLDPRFATDATSSRVNRLLYRGLVDFDPEGRPVPALARWERLDPDRYRFTLGEAGRTFSDGGRLTAQDVVATFASILDPATRSPHRPLLALITRMAALGTEQVEFELSRPDPLFPAYLTLGILPAARIAAGHPFERAPVGSGSFRFLAWPEQGRLVLERVADGERLELQVVAEPSVRVMKLLRGEIDLLQNDLPPELFRWLQGRAEVRVEARPGSNFSYLAFNLEDPHTAKLAVRRAVAQAIDRAAIIRYVFDGAAREAQALFPPDHWAGAPDLVPHAYDPDRARALLAEAGYDETHPLRLVYKTSNDPFRVRLATLIQAQLAQVGIRVVVQSYDWGTFYDDVKSGRFQMVSLSWVAVRTPDIFRHAFHSGSVPPDGVNRGRYRSERVDAVLDDIAALEDLAPQVPQYRVLQRLLLEDLPYVPLWYEDQRLAARAEIGGYRLSAEGNYDGLQGVRRTPGEARGEGRGHARDH